MQKAKVQTLASLPANLELHAQHSDQIIIALLQVE